MRIFVGGSMQFSEEMVQCRNDLEKLGHTVTLPAYVDSFLGKNAAEQESLKLEQKNTRDAMRIDCAQLKEQDALLVLNLDKNGIPNYIGGNCLIELGYAHILGHTIFLYNDIPDIQFYKSEIAAMRPTILNGDLSKI